MNMRDIIDLVENIKIFEAKSENVTVSYWSRASHPPKEVRVTENPTMWDLIALCKQNTACDYESNLRGFLYKGTVFVWPAAAATHGGIQTGMGFEEPGKFNFYDSDEVTNFHITGRGWQEGQSIDNYIIVQNEADKKKMTKWAQRWRLPFGGNYY